MATKSSSGGGNRGGNVSLGDEDRRYLSENLDSASERIGEAVDESGVFEALERFGLGSDRVKRLRKSLSKLDVGESVQKASEYLSEQIDTARDYAKGNPKKVIGGAAGVLVGASLLAMAIRRASEEKKKSRAKKSAASSASGSKARSSKKAGSRSSKAAGSSSASSPASSSAAKKPSRKR